MTTQLEQHVLYAGTDRNVRLSNAEVELVLPLAYGPRVMRYASRSSGNVFAEVDPTKQGVRTPFGDDWHIYGGHRLWAAPEDAVASYYPDNAPVELQHTEGVVTLTQNVEPHSGLQKSIRVRLHDDSSHVSVTHSLKNCGGAPVELAPWALSAMAPGGTALFPHSPYVPHPDALAPARPLVLWPFTRMGDIRFGWGDRFVRLQQDENRPSPQKFGSYDQRGYMAYQNREHLFIKCHLPRRGPHADFGCNAQTFTNELFLELETLGPLVSLAPQQSVEHREEWFLFDFPERVPSRSDDELRTLLTPVLRRVVDSLRAHACSPELTTLLSSAARA